MKGRNLRRELFFSQWNNITRGMFLTTPTCQDGITEALHRTESLKPLAFFSLFLFWFVSYYYYYYYYSCFFYSLSVAIYLFRFFFGKKRKRRKKDVLRDVIIESLAHRCNISTTIFPLVTVPPILRNLSEESLEKKRKKERKRLGVQTRVSVESPIPKNPRTNSQFIGGRDSFASGDLAEKIARR